MAACEHHDPEKLREVERCHWRAGSDDLRRIPAFVRLSQATASVLQQSIALAK